MPERKLQTALSRLSRVAKVRERTQSAQDITGAVVSVARAPKDARTERRSLLRQLARRHHDEPDREHPRAAAARLRARSPPPSATSATSSRARPAPRSRSPLLADRSRRGDGGAAGRPATRSTTPCASSRSPPASLLVAARAAAPARARRPARVARGARQARAAAARARARRRVAWRGRCRRRPRTPARGLLGRVPVFAELAEEDLARVAEVAVPRAFDPQQVIFREGDDSDTCYIVRSGHARAIRQHADGRMITLATFGPGDIFGELAMFDDERRSATLEALDELATLAIPGSAMRAPAAPPPRDRGQARDRARAPPAGRQRAALAPVVPDRAEPRRVGARPARRAGARRGRGGESDVLVTATQAELAQLAAPRASPPARFLAVLERAGVISQGRGRLTVHDPAALQRLCLSERDASRAPTAGSSCATGDVLVITPARRGRRSPRCPRAARPGRERGADRRARGARGDGRRGAVLERLGDVELLVPARRPAHLQDRRASTSATTSRATPPTTTTRSRRRAGCRSRRRADRAQLSRRARDDRARTVENRGDR